MIAYKFLRPDGTGVFTAYSWPLPNGGPGPWVEARVEPCRSGIHACRPEHLPLWAGHTLYEMELDGEIVDERTKVIASTFPSPVSSSGERRKRSSIRRSAPLGSRAA